ncbi:hypothetical protein SPRG_09993, partial [Saprolegnia parasitica CBS 223.65]
LPLPVKVVQRYVDHLTQYNSHNHVNGAKSALFFLHKDVCAISPELDAMMTKFLHGYKPDVATY